MDWIVQCGRDSVAGQFANAERFSAAAVRLTGRESPNIWPVNSQGGCANKAELIWRGVDC